MEKALVKEIYILIINVFRDQLNIFKAAGWDPQLSRVDKVI